jgi:F-type H+-transporting ATPase subunit epsilon
MAKEFALSVVAADRSVIDTVATSVIAPGAMGYFGVMAGHEPMVIALKAGIIEYESADKSRHILAISGGFAEVNGERVMVLADSATFSHEVDVEFEKERLEKARRVMRGEDSSMTLQEATDVVEVSLAKLRAGKFN